MGMKDLKPLLTIGTVFIFSSNVSAWRPFFPSTHGEITAKAISNMDHNQYPDMIRASDRLIDGSASERAHEGLHTKGGAPKDWWEGKREATHGGVLTNYRMLMFKNAYKNLGRVAHITEDQAVPSHVANIPHDVLTPDGLESFAMHNKEIDPLPSIENNLMPYEYYQMLQDETRSGITGWINPSNKKHYWVVSKKALPLGKDNTFGPTGRYGGSNNSFIDSPIPALCRNRLAAAAGYAKALFEAASKKLPPLVMNLKVSPNLAAPGQATKISFTALENRTAKVRYAVILRRKDSQAETILAGETGLRAPGKEGYLFEGNISLTWAGALSGKAAAEGSYSLEVELTDEDGNTVPPEVNTDAITENDSKTVLTILSTEANETPASISFQ